MAAKKKPPRDATLDDLLASGLRYSPIEQAPTPANAEPAPSGMLRRAADYGLTAIKGMVAVPEAAVGLADMVTGGHVGKFLENEGGMVGFRPKQAREALDEWLSPEQKAANQQVQKAEGVFDVGMAALRNPSVVGHAVVESLPLMLGGGVIARSLMKAMPRMGAVAGGAAGEGVMAAGSSAESIRQESANGLLTGTQSALAGASGAATGLLGFLGGRVAQRLGITDIDTLIAGKAAPAVNKSFVRKVIEGAFAEGVLEELPQSVQEQVAQNLALDRPLDEGVDHAAVLGTLAGGVMGGGAQLFSRSPGDQIRQNKLPAAGPMTRAVNAPIEEAAKAADASTTPLNTINQEPPPAPADPPIAMPPLRADALDVLERQRAIDEAALRVHEPAASTEQPEPGDMLNPKGEPFRNKRAATQAQKKAGEGFGVQPVAGGYVVRKKKEVEDVAQPDPAAAVAGAAPAGGSGVALGSPEPVDGLAADPAGAGEPAAAIAAPGGEPDAPVGDAGEPDAALSTQALPEEALAGEQMDEDWSAFKPDTGTKGVPRAEMPQIKAGDRSAMVQFLRARGVNYGEDEVVASSLKPTQAEFSPAKVRQARDFSDTDRAILVSSDGHVLDGHHQWMAKLDQGEPVRVIRLDAPIDDLIAAVREFPSAKAADGATEAQPIADQQAPADVPRETTQPSTTTKPDSPRARREKKAAEKQAAPTAAVQPSGKSPGKPPLTVPDAEPAAPADKPAEKPLSARNERSEVEAAPKPERAEGFKVVPAPREGRFIVGEPRSDGTMQNLAEFGLSSTTDKPVGIQHFFESSSTREPVQQAIRARSERRIKERSERSNPMTARAEPKPAPTTSPNTIFTDDAAEKARAILRKKMGPGTLRSGVDPEILQAGITLAGYHIERGARTFAAYAKAMVEDLGEAVRPYLKSWYNALRDYPGFDATGLDSYESVSAIRPEAIGEVGDAGFDQSTADRVAMVAGLFGDDAQRQAISEHGFQGLRVDQQQRVLAQVRDAIQDLKIRRAVVDAVPVDVMNMLIGRELSTEELLRDGSVLKDRLAVDRQAPVPMTVVRIVDALAAFVKREGAGTRAESAAAGGQLGRAPVSRGAALQASDRGHGEDGTSSDPRAPIDVLTMPDAAIDALAGKTLSIDLVLGSSGKTTTMNVDAAFAVRDMRKRLAAAEELARCLA